VYDEHIMAIHYIYLQYENRTYNCLELMDMKIWNASPTVPTSW